MVHFIGAGPGAPDLITLRGAELLKQADVIIYAGSRVNPALLELASLPGGFCPAAAERAGYLAARGLPGVYAPEAAAAVIRRAIFRELDLEECP